MLGPAIRSEGFVRPLEEGTHSGSGARAYGVPEEVEASGMPLLSEFDGHPSVRTLVAGGYSVITF